MTVKWQKYEDFNSNLHKKIGTRIVKKHHKGKRVDKLFNFSNKVNQNLIYLGEILVVGLFSFSTLIFGNGTSLVNNTSLVYPVDEISKLECRHKTWPELDKNCKMKLPLIEGANFQKYGANPLYTNTYTTASLIWKCSKDSIYLQGKNVLFDLWTYGSDPCSDWTAAYQGAKDRYDRTLWNYHGKFRRKSCAF